MFIVVFFIFMVSWFIGQCVQARSGRCSVCGGPIPVHTVLLPLFLQWGSRFAVISRSAVGQTLSVNQLVDMEWRFGVTASSNEAQRVGSSFLQLRLLINKGNANEEVFMGECGCLFLLYSHSTFRWWVLCVPHVPSASAPQN